MATDTPTIEDLRTEYRLIRKRSHAKSPADFDAAVKALNPQSPEDYVAAARNVTFPCRRCAGTGQFITGMLNGKPTGPGGPCYRCNGKGFRDDRDQRRNYGHDKHAFARAARAMMGGE